MLQQRIKFLVNDCFVYLFTGNVFAHRKKFPPSPVQRTFLNRKVSLSDHSLAAICNACFYSRENGQSTSFSSNMVEIFVVSAILLFIILYIYIFFTKRFFITFVYKIFRYGVFDFSGGGFYGCINT